MLRAPKTLSMPFTTVASVARAFVKLRQVEGDVACLASGRKGLAYRGILRVKTIHFSQMAIDEQQRVIEGFRGFLDILTFPIQILIRNRPYNPEHYLQLLASGKDTQTPLTRDHMKFVLALASRRALVTREFYVIVPADPPTTKKKAEALLQAQIQLEQRMQELAYQLEQAGLATKRLTGDEIVQLYQSCYSPWEELSAEDTCEQSVGKPGEVSRSNEKRAAREKARKKQMPKYMQALKLILPTTIQVFPSYLRVEKDGQRVYARTLALVSYPHSASPGWLEGLIQVNESNIDVSIHINVLSSESARARLGQKSLQFRSATLVSMRQGRAADPSITNALSDVEGLHEHLASGSEQALAISAFIQIRGRNRRELDTRSERIAGAIHSLDCRVLPTHWQHHTGLLSCLPEAMNPLGRSRLFGTNAAATFYPFSDSDISMDTGIMFGAHPGGSLILLNPFKRSVLENSNLIVLAKAGAGKSFFLKTVLSRLLPTCYAYTLDADGGYGILCETARGRSVSLTADSLLLNPLELYGSANNQELLNIPSKGEANFFREKLLNLMALFELMLSDEGGLSPKEKVVLSRCLVEVYEKHGIGPDPATHGYIPPTMREFYELLTEALQSEKYIALGQELRKRLKRWLPLFPEHTQVVLDNRLINFTLHDLSHPLKPVGMFLVAEFLWTRLYQAARQSKGQALPAIFLIDELWPLMKFQQGAKFLAELAHHLPGYGAGLWCATRHARGFLGSEEGKSIQSMAAMKFFMRQDSGTIDAVTQACHLNPEQEHFLLRARRGEGLFATKNWSPMEVLASPLEVKMASPVPAPTPDQETTADHAQTTVEEKQETPVSTERRERSESRRNRG